MMDRKLSPLKIAIYYTVLGLAWIISSDFIVLKITKHPKIITEFSIVKGWLFVLVTAALLYLLINSYSKQRSESDIALRENEKRFRAFFEAHCSVMLLLDPDTGGIVDANQAAADYYGFSRDTLRSMTISDINALSAEELANQLRCAAVAQCNSFVFPHRLAGGEIRTVEVFTSPIEVNQKKLLFSIIHDITERKLAEEALQKSEKMLQTIIDAEPECVKVLDENANLIMMNPAGLDMLQADSFDQVRGQCVCPLITSEYRPAFMELTKRVCQGESGTLLFEMIGMKGRHSWLETHAVPLRNEKNEITALLGVTRDVTEHKRAEEELREKEEKYRLLFESANDGIFIQDEIAFMDCNQKGAEMYRLSKEEIIGRSPSEFAPEHQPDGRLSSEVAAEKIRAALSGVPQVFEWQSVRADKSRFDVEITLSRLELGGKMCLQAIVRDISERKRAEEEREKLQAELYQSQKMESVGRLAGGVAHDFNNMLSAILGCTEMAMMESNPPGKIHDYLEVIEQSALRSVDLVRQLLAFARKQTVAPKVLDLNDTLAGLLKMLRRLIGEDIDFALLPGAGLWPIKIDPSQIDQLLANLCVNARDAIAGVGTITVKTENAFLDEAYCAVHPGVAPGEYVMLAVSDNGCGMSKEVIAHLFEPFFTTKEAGKGTGLGLATVYGIIEQNEGVIDVYSEPGKGSTFTIYLPRFSGEVMEPTVASATETPKGHGETVLLVEDETSILNISQEMLEALGYRVLTASTPSEALRQVKAYSSQIQLLITDVVMPEMNGRELAKLLSEINPDLKCLFSSGYTADIIAHRGMLDEGVCFLKKPFSRKDLAIKVREALER